MVKRSYQIIKTIAMVGENGFHQGRIHSVGLLLIDKSSKLPTFVSNHGYACILCTRLWTRRCIDTDCQDWILGHEHLLGFRRSLCKARKWSLYEYKSSICLSHQELLIGYASRNIPWRTNMASIKWGYYIALKVKSLLWGKDHWMTFGSAITHSTNLN